VGRRIRLVAVALAAMLAVAACGKDEKAPQAAPTGSGPKVVSSGTLAAGQKVAAPREEVVLTMSGAIGARNQGKKLALDLASLERMRTVQLEATEPYLKKKLTFEGVMLSDLLAVADVPESATKLHVTALDDYKVDFSLADVRSSRMLLATKTDGKHMPVERAGPIRIVFPDDASLGRNPGLWIWSISDMQVS
jgi:hypothetical protein